jgi:RND family efflux transporter MFP subunit
VRASYPGASAQVVEDVIAAPIEQQIYGVEDLVSMRSSCCDGSYWLHITFKQGVDLKIAQLLIQNRVSAALPILPEAVKRIGVTVREESHDPLWFVALFSPDNSRDTLYLNAYAAIQLKDELARLPGVGTVEVLGGQDFGLHIWLDLEKLAAYGLMVSDVTKAIQEQTRETGPKSGADEGPGSPADLILKSGGEGGLIRLRDVARIEFGGRCDGALTRIDAKPAVVIGIAHRSRADISEVETAVRTQMDALKQRFPAGIDYTMTFDLAQSLRARTPPFLLVDVGLPDSVSLEKTSQILNRCEKLLLVTPGIEHVLVLSRNPFARIANRPCVLAKLASPDDGTEKMELVEGRIRDRLKEIDEADWRLCRMSAGVPQLTPELIFGIHGPDRDKVNELGLELSKRLVETKKLRDLAASCADAPQLHIEIDRAKAAMTGVALNDIVSTLDVYRGPIHVTDFTRFARRWPVRIQADVRGGGKLVEDMKRVQVRGNKGNVAISTVASIREVSSPKVIARFNGQPLVEITANPAPGVSLAEARGLIESIVQALLPPEMQLTWMQELPKAKFPAATRDSHGPETEPLDVQVSRPVVREVTDYVDFPGRTQAISTVEIRARVTGYLMKCLFKEGTQVKSGDVLFDIDPRPYQAVLDQTQAQLQLAEVRLKLAATENARATKLAPGSLSQVELDKYAAAATEALAGVAAAKAAVESAKLNLAFTKITAPISGRIGRRHVDPGNVIKADETLLTTIVAHDPIYCYFDVDERTILLLRRQERDDKTRPLREGRSPVLLGVAGEEGYSHQGVIDFVDNQFNPDTGTLRLRGVFPNPAEILSPGMFARIRLRIGEPHKALLVSEAAILNDQGVKFVYVVDSQNKAEYRRIAPGAQQADGLRVVDNGLQAQDRVIISGLRRMHPALLVRPREMPMPVKAQ